MRGTRIIAKAMTLIKNAGDVMEQGIGACNNEIETRNDLIDRYGAEKNELSRAVVRAGTLLKNIRNV